MQDTPVLFSTAYGFTLKQFISLLKIKALIAAPYIVPNTWPVLQEQQFFCKKYWHTQNKTTLKKYIPLVLHFFLWCHSLSFVTFPSGFPWRWTIRTIIHSVAWMLLAFTIAITIIAVHYFKTKSPAKFWPVCKIAFAQIYDTTTDIIWQLNIFWVDILHPNDCLLMKNLCKVLHIGVHLPWK